MPFTSGKRHERPRQRAKIVRDFERHALSEAYTVPLLWWNRIVAT
jgi:peptide/nickel transport system substrate-binding protein